MSEYTRMVEEFCKKTNTKITITYKGTVCNPWNEKGYLNTFYYNRYTIRIDRNHKSMYVTFTDSKHNTDEGLRPSKYDVLACLQKFDVGSFEDFIFAYGYDYNSMTEYKRIMKLYKAVQREYNSVMRLFSDCIEELAEIW